MADNVQKLPFGRTLQEHARRKVLEHVQLMSGRAPATLVKATDGTNTIWMVKFDTDGTYTLPQVTMPVHGSEYQRVPYQQGAKGFVGASDIETGNMTGLRAAKSPVDFTRPANLSSMVWHPLGNVNFKAAIDPNAHETYGASGGTITHDGTAKSIVKTHKDEGSSISTGGDGSGAVGPHNFKANNGSTESNTTGQHKTNAPDGHMVSDDQTVGKDITSTAGNIMAAAGNISAPAGNVSGATGSFGGGSIGGLSLLGGILSGGGGGSPSLMIAPEEVSAATVRTNVAYTVLQLNTQMPAGPGMLGVRAYVIDAQDPVTFRSLLEGGGAQGSPAVCLYGTSSDTTGASPGYYWAAG